MAPRRLAWRPLLELPVGLRPQVIEIWPVPGLLGLRHAVAHPGDGTQPGSLAIIEVVLTGATTAPGHPVHHEGRIAAAKAKTAAPPKPANIKLLTIYVNLS